MFLWQGLKVREFLILGDQSQNVYSAEFNWVDERHTGHFFMYNFLRPSIRVPRTQDVYWGDLTRSSFEEPHTYDLTGTAVVRGTKNG